MTIEESLKTLRKRRDTCWQMAATFLENEDAHGIMDMGAEIQALDRSIKELEKFK